MKTDQEEKETGINTATITTTTSYSNCDPEVLLAIVILNLVGTRSKKRKTQEK